LNIEQNLLFVKDEDQTSKIKYCEYSDGKYEVTYINGKIYRYNTNNITWIRKPKSLDPALTLVSIRNQPIPNILKILLFGDKYIRIVFKAGQQKVYLQNELIIERNCINEKKTGDCLSYLKQLAAVVGITSEKGESGFLSKQFEMITQISPDSVFSLFLDPKPLVKSNERKQLIFPFGFNLSQKTAGEEAFCNSLSVIEGPPGTGKTQTILNLIANAIMENKTVAIVSNNNSATSNVLEKLEKYGVDFIAAYLGNTENKEIFFKDQKLDYPDMKNWKLEILEASERRKNLENQGQKLDEMLEKRNMSAKSKQELSEVLIEKEYFDLYENETSEQPIKYKSLYSQKASSILKLWVEFRQIVEQGTPMSITGKIKFLLRFGIYDFKFYNNPEDRILSLFQKLFYEYRIGELVEEIKTLDKQLEDYKFDKAMKIYEEVSMSLFKSYLAKRFSANERPTFNADILKKDTSKFLEEYPVILSTTHSIKRCAQQNFQFDYIIMDESTQVDLVTGALALSCAKKAIIVGDLMQLPNVVSSETKEITDEIFESYNLSDAYRYSSNSILSSILELFPEVPKTMLKEHYRCHPKIIGFCNKKYYNDELIVLTEEKSGDQPMALYKTVIGNHARGNFNQRQVDAIFDEIIPNLGISGDQGSIGIVSPYRRQTEEMQRRATQNQIEADTVHKFQGREKEIIILSTVANEINEFVDNPNLLNVAVSRAVKKLIVVASEDIAESSSNLGDLARYIKYNNFVIQESKIYSVFDLLYRQYSKQLLESLGEKRAGLDAPSEILIDNLLKNVLARLEFRHLDKVLHQPLKMLIRDPVLLDENECKFAMNINAHTDFLIFNKFDKSPVLVIEVDGYFFHANNPKQLERDKIKDGILGKYNIPILRLPTNGSGEEEKICRKLGEIKLN
jgi:hypothetical protein